MCGSIGGALSLNTCCEKAGKPLYCNGIQREQQLQFKGLIMQIATTPAPIPAAEIPDGQYFIQQHGGKEPWTPSDRPDLLQRLASDHLPAFRTVLGATQFGADGKPTHLIGPFYADFDGDLPETCENFKVFLRKLQEHDVDLDQVRLYASGGRGFHCEVPQAVFTPTPGAVENLHRIYREMAFGLFVDTMDIRVYSVKRQWRVPHVKRENGLFKVPLTVAEALAVTPENYAELCAAPRPFPPLKTPTLAGGLAALYVKARDKAAKKQARNTSSAAGEALKARFAPRGDALPPSLLALAEGRIPAREGVGFNLIAIQLSATAVGMGVDLDQFIGLCAGLIANHQSDGTRYNSPSKRKSALVEMFRFVEKSNYKPSVAAIRSILPQGLKCLDLRGL